MFELAMIEECINEMITNGAKKISIYPYGKNGIRVENVLERIFAIQPYHIIDNEKAANTKEVITLDCFLNNKDDDEYVILTAEKKELLCFMKEQLVSVMPLNKFICLADYKDVYKSIFYHKTANRLRLTNLLPDFKKKDTASGKNNRIKIRVVFSRVQTFNTVSSVCNSIMKDSELDLLLIIGWDQRGECVELAENHGFKYVLWQEYDVKTDAPDILLLYMTYDYVTQLPNIREYVKLVVVLCTQLVRNTFTIADFWKVQQRSFERFEPDYFICDRLLYREIIKTSSNIPYELVEMGNPKYDGIYNACKQKKYPIGWDKLKGKTTIFWGPDHGFFDGATRHTTFDLYAKEIFKFFFDNCDIGLIFRPHPEMKLELVQQGYWTKSEWDLLVQYCNDSQNIILDETENYDSAYSVADAILTDASCGISISALPTQKPICVAYRSVFDNPYNPEIISNYYSIRNNEELLTFFDMIKMGEDPLFEERISCIEQCVKFFDGENGNRIKNFIKQKYIEMEK